MEPNPQNMESNPQNIHEVISIWFLYVSFDGTRDRGWCCRFNVPDLDHYAYRMIVSVVRDRGCGRSYWWFGGSSFRSNTCNPCNSDPCACGPSRCFEFESGELVDLQNALIKSSDLRQAVGITLTSVSSTVSILLVRLCRNLFHLEFCLRFGFVDIPLACSIPGSHLAHGWPSWGSSMVVLSILPLKNSTWELGTVCFQLISLMKLWLYLAPEQNLLVFE